MNRIFAGAVATTATHIDGIIENLGNLHTVEEEEEEEEEEETP